MYVRVDEITGVPVRPRALPIPPTFLWVGGPVDVVLGPGEDAVPHFYVGDLYDASGCAWRSWRPGKRCASGTAITSSHGSIEATSWPDRLTHRDRRPAGAGEQWHQYVAETT